MSTLSTQQKSDIDRLWTEFWTGGITNPLTVIEQISFLMFARLLDVTETRNEKKAERTKKPFKRIFGPDQQHLRWSHFRQLGKGDEMLRVVRDEVFPHFRKLNGNTTFSEYMQDAQLMVQKASLLVSAVEKIDKLPIIEGDAKGDLYEYLLSKLTTAGINGQFRTPRHVIRFMVELVEPKRDEVIGDPACGTAGFLVGTMQYLLETYTSAKGKLKGEAGEVIYTGDQLEAYRDHIQNEMFHGFDFDSTMLRIASMNLMLHGVENPDIHNQDTLSNSFHEKFPKQAEGGFDVILANPPFKGSLDEGDVHPSLTQKVKTKKTELLFVSLILRMLKKGGRSATIVPDGVLFGSSKAHQALRQLLVQDNQLEAVISLPSGVFKPYAGVSTAIIVFSKGGKTDNVFFYDIQSDGFSLDDKRDPTSTELGPLGPTKDNDLYDALARWRKKNAKKDTDRTAKYFMVSAKEIEEKGFDLSINRYSDSTHEELSFDPPETIIARLRELEATIVSELADLEASLK
jgi:type I restriction enzyme M protein